MSDEPLSVRNRREEHEVTARTRNMSLETAEALRLGERESIRITRSVPTGRVWLWELSRGKPSSPPAPPAETVEAAARRHWTEKLAAIDGELRAMPGKWHTRKTELEHAKTEAVAQLAALGGR